MSTPNIPQPTVPTIRSSADRPKTPVTVLTGFLGSGKTTLVNHILTTEHGLKVAVIENEFGDIGIDNALVIGGDETIIEMSNGCCLCCTARTDLIDILHSLAERPDRFDRILVETSGMADPNPVAQTFFVDEEVAEHYTLDAIVTLVDARHVQGHLDETQVDGVGNHTSNQIAFADRIVINKVDLVDEATLAAVTERVRSINASAQILTSHYGAVDLTEILGIRAFRRAGGQDSGPDWLHGSEHSHDPTLESVSIELAGEVPLDRLRSWLDAYIAAHGDEVYRLKGILRASDQPCAYFLQGVHRLYDIFPAPGADPAPDRSVLVFIGRNLDRDQLTGDLQRLVGDPVLAS